MAKKIIVNILLLLIILSRAIVAKEIYVPSQSVSIQKAIEIADSNDIIILEPGVYKENILITKSITLTSKYFLKKDTSFISRTVIDGSLKNSVLTIKTGKNQVCKILGLTIQNGKSNNLYKDRGLTLGGGGGIFIEASSPVLEQLVIRNNQSPFDGGGIFVKGIAAPILKHVILSKNFADRNGGGFYCYSASPVFINCQMLGNKSNNSGGACFFSISSPVMTDCFIVENSAMSNGGGINYYCNYSDSAKLNHVTIAANIAKSKGGGIYFTGQTGENFPNVILSNSIVWGNSLDNIGLDADFKVVVKYTSTSMSSAKNGNLVMSESMVYTDPLLDSYYRLQPGSPCIDAAIIDNRNYHGKAPDLGAYESDYKAKKTELPSADTVNANSTLIEDTIMPVKSAKIQDSILEEKRIIKYDSVSMKKPKPIKVYRKPYK